MTAARIACLFKADVSPTADESSNCQGVSTRLTGYPLRGRSSRGRVSLLDIRSPGLLSRRVSTLRTVIATAGRGLPLSDQRPLSRTGTLDAHCWFPERAN